MNTTTTTNKWGRRLFDSEYWREADKKLLSEQYKSYNKMCKQNVFMFFWMLMLMVLYSFTGTIVWLTIVMCLLYCACAGIFIWLYKNNRRQRDKYLVELLAYE